MRPAANKPSCDPLLLGLLPTSSQGGRGGRRKAPELGRVGSNQQPGQLFALNVPPVLASPAAAALCTTLAPETRSGGRRGPFGESRAAGGMMRVWGARAGEA